MYCEKFDDVFSLSLRWSSMVTAKILLPTVEVKILFRQPAEDTNACVTFESATVYFANAIGRLCRAAAVFFGECKRTGGAAIERDRYGP